jgi:hypothetical protein
MSVLQRVSCRRPAGSGILRRAAGLAAAGLLMSHAAANAEGGPSVGELLAVCERAAAAGHRGVDAATCEWFAVPCDCKLLRGEDDAVRWCMPAQEGIDTATLKVVAALRRALARDASLAAADTRSLVPGIMAGLYPCAD